MTPLNTTLSFSGYSYCNLLRIQLRFFRSLYTSNATDDVTRVGTFAVQQFYPRNTLQFEQAKLVKNLNRR